MAVSDDVADVTRFMMSLVEDPAKLTEFKRDPQAVIAAADLREGALAMLEPTGGRIGTVVVVVVIIFVIVA